LLEYGKSLFKNVMTQFFLTCLCFGLVLFAKHFASGFSHLSLEDFLSTGFDSIFSNQDQFKMSVNVVIPFFFYIIAGCILSWMAITNFMTIQLEENKLDMSLKFVLALAQGTLSIWFLLIGGKLFIFFLIFSLLILLVIGGIIYLFATRPEH
jgi:hypothetical protein